jgi:hypothetical protein
VAYTSVLKTAVLACAATAAVSVSVLGCGETVYRYIERPAPDAGPELDAGAPVSDAGMVDASEPADAGDADAQVDAGGPALRECRIPNGTSSNYTKPVVFRSDADLRPFADCWRIARGIIIEGQGITDLGALKHLTTVDGDIVIKYTRLVDLKGLGKLAHGEGRLVIRDNPMLTSLSGLEGLATTTRSIVISGNDLLTNLKGLDNLQSAYQLSIGNAWPNYCAHDRSAAPDVQGNALLESLEGLEKLEQVGELSIIGNPLVKSFAPLVSLKRLSVLFIGHSAGLTDLQTLPSAVVGQVLSVHGNPNLTTLEGLDHLMLEPAPAWLAVRIVGNDVLTSLEGLGHIVSSARFGVVIAENPKLASLSSLSDATSFAGTLRLQRNHALTDLSGLDGVTHLGRDLSIVDNDGLESLHGLEKLAHFGGSLGVSGNAKLKNLDALVSLENIGYAARLDSEGGGCFYDDNWYDFPPSYGVFISDNPALTSIAGLDNLSNPTSDVFSVRIENNASLPKCALDAWLSAHMHTCACPGNDETAVCEAP